MIPLFREAPGPLLILFFIIFILLLEFCFSLYIFFKLLSFDLSSTTTISFLFVGFLFEIYGMIQNNKIDLADLLLLFIYVEVMGMTRVYLLSDEIRITYPLIIAITAISRLIILQKKDLDPSILVYESVAILIIALAIIVLRLRYLKGLEPKKNQK